MNPTSKALAAAALLLGSSQVFAAPTTYVGSIFNIQGGNKTLMHWDVNATLSPGMQDFTYNVDLNTAGTLADGGFITTDGFADQEFHFVNGSGSTNYTLTVHSLDLEIEMGTFTSSGIVKDAFGKNLSGETFNKLDGNHTWSPNFPDGGLVYTLVASGAQNFEIDHGRILFDPTHHGSMYNGGFLDTSGPGTPIFSGFLWGSSWEYCEWGCYHKDIGFDIHFGGRPTANGTPELGTFLLLGLGLLAMTAARRRFNYTTLEEGSLLA